MKYAKKHKVRCSVVFEDLDGHKEGPKLKVKMTKQEAITSKKCVAFNGCLDKLIRFAVGNECRTCKADKTFVHKPGEVVC